MAATALHGGQPGPLLATLDTALLPAAQQATATTEHVDTTVAAARQVGGQGN